MEPQSTDFRPHASAVLDLRLPSCRLRPGATDEAPSSTRSLAELAFARLKESRTESELAAWWPRLRSGEIRLSLLLHEALHSIAVFRERHIGERRRTLNGRPLEILERVLSGQPLNYISIELGVSNSTVSLDFKQAATLLGMPRRVAGLPVLLAQMWQATQTSSPRGVETGTVTADSLGWTVLRIARPDVALEHYLTPCELAVGRLLLEGLAHAAIARRLAKRERTVSNQIAAIFRKLRVSGRLELVMALVRGALPRVSERRWTANRTRYAPPDSVHTTRAVVGDRPEDVEIPQTRQHHGGIRLTSAGSGTLGQAALLSRSQLERDSGSQPEARA
jgi:DNA-binding NarL/FixJ family response regulator